MKVFRNIASFLLLLPVLFSSCVEENWPEANKKTGEWMIPFSVDIPSDYTISTKATMSDPQSEWDIYNLYVFVFDKEGNKLFGEFFDQDPTILNPTSSPLPDNYWEFSHQNPHTGTVHIKSSQSKPANNSSCTIVVLSNLNSKMVNITPDQLKTVKNMEELKKIQATLLQLILSRSGYFPMCGMKEGVDLSDETFTLNSEIKLRRLDAKIQFNVRAAAGHGIYEFTPVSWQIVNVPKNSYLLEGTSVSAVGQNDFFNGRETIFETETIPKQNEPYYGTTYESGVKIPTHGFSFYMLENKKDPKTPAPTTWTYEDRDRMEGSSFKYANDLATYVILKGRLVLNDGTEIKHAEVKYIIHLGNFGPNSYNNFQIKRNSTYTFDILIQGVSHIVTYVTTTSADSQEPGASGEIVVPLRKIFTCDSHYSTHIIDFYYKDIKDRGLGWWVRTPFSDGVKSDSYGQISDPVDCNWVEFRVNTKSGTPATYPTGIYAEYKPIKGSPADNAGKGDGKTYTITTLMSYLKGEVDKYESDNAETKASSAFDNQDDPNKAKISVTAFVNEYYYEKDPLTGAFDKDLWREFVNQPMRTMCILSADQSRGESRYVRASYIIQQYSIQSVFNINSPKLESAWGGEYFTDDKEAQCRHYAKENNYSSDNRHNDDVNNGRKDSMIEWGLMTSGNTYDALAFDNDNKKEWSTYLQYDKYEGTDATYGSYEPPYLNDAHRYLRYSCMSRNRDNNGDGKIDQDEIRWYMAASNQLISMFLGSYGIEASASLYQRTPEERASNVKDVWRQHVLASNRNTARSGSKSDTHPRMVWAEQGLNGSDLGYGFDYERNHSGTKGKTDDHKEQTNEFSVRCVRNVGYDSSQNADITYSSEAKNTDPLIVVTPMLGNSKYIGGWSNLQDYQDVYFDIDCSRVNPHSMRYYTDRELVKHDEHTEAACLYEHFQTNTISNSSSVTETDVMVLNQAIEDSGKNIYCPTGYRLPNVREVGVLCYFLTDSQRKAFIQGGKFTLARTYYSFGTLGGSNKKVNEWGWGVSPDKTLMAISGNQKTISTRCVKDVEVTNNTP